ncbi:MAG: prepilin-type N-terminal cleavage/methylation domain-containing protein [Desulfomonilia bacterium]|jgi:prepilin-type N-terminal cleavage/methylation domain-containing protein
MDKVIIYSSHKKPSGFTLIELVVAILVFAIGLVGILKMHQASIQSNNFSMQLTQAMNIAEDKIDYLRGLGVNNTSMTVGTHNFVTVTSMGVPYAITTTVSVTPNTNSLGRNVNLTITWNEKTIPHSLDLNETFTP